MDELLELGFKNVSYLLHPGVYVLCYRGEAVYVGQSRRPLSRIGQHFNGYIRFDRVYFIRCECDELAELESRMIHTLMPRLNKNRPVVFHIDYKALNIDMEDIKRAVMNHRYEFLGPNSKPVGFLRRF
jgi:hypothetical protein